jgi:hypothetical protein
MERYCSTGKSPQPVVEPKEEEEEEVIGAAGRFECVYGSLAMYNLQGWICAQ